MTIAEWNALKIGDKIVRSFTGQECEVIAVVELEEVHKLCLSGVVEGPFWTIVHDWYWFPEMHHEPRAVVSWCPEEVADKLGIPHPDGAQFLDEIEDELEEAMTKAGWEFILAKAAERGWEEVDG